MGLDSRARELRTALAPCGHETARVIYASLAGMAARAPDGYPAMRRALAAQEVDDLALLPAFALSAAAASYRRGDVGDGKWRPTAGELAVEARKRASPLHAELGKLSKVLNAPTVVTGPRISQGRFEELKDMLASVTASKTFGG